MDNEITETKANDAVASPVDVLVIRRELPDDWDDDYKSLWLKLQKSQERIRDIRRNSRQRDAKILANARLIIKANKSTDNWKLICDLFGVGVGTAYKRCRDLGLDPDSNETSYGGMIKFLGV